jgi:hypothetical protein
LQGDEVDKCGRREEGGGGGAAAAEDAAADNVNINVQSRIFAIAAATATAAANAAAAAAEITRESCRTRSREWDMHEDQVDALLVDPTECDEEWIDDESLALAAAREKGGCQEEEKEREGERKESQGLILACLQASYRLVPQQNIMHYGYCGTSAHVVIHS